MMAYIKKNKELTIALIILVIAAMLRLVFVDIPNIAPVAAMALFAGAYFKNRKWAFIWPIALLLVTDIALEVLFRAGLREYSGIYSGMIFVYGSFALIVALGMLLHKRVNVVSTALAALGGSTLFFLVTNFGVWLLGDGLMYTKDLSGLINCYVMAIPFYKYTLLGDLGFVALFFGAFELIRFYARRSAVA